VKIEELEEELLEECGIEELYGVSKLPQTEHLFTSKMRDIKDRLEELYRREPEEFYQRKVLIQKAIKEREGGQTRTMSELTLDELNELLKFTGRLYR